MKRLLPIVATAVVLGLGFAVYFHFQPTYRASGVNETTVDQFPDSNAQGSGLLRAGSGAWVKQYDREGQLYYQFKSAYYDPQPDGTVKVTSPLIQFFLSNHQVLQIEGSDGVIRFAPGADKNIAPNSPTDPPRNGNLRNVKVKLFASADQVNSGDPDMTMTMTNAEFDNDTYRLFTQEYTDANGKVIHADDVPVTVRSRDYSFRGSGLVMYWNDVDHRLKSLEVARGTDLAITNVGGITGDRPAGPAPSEEANPGPAPQAAATAPPPTTSASPPEAPERYTASFFDNVRVVESQDAIKADRMDVDFVSRGQGSAPTVVPSAPAPPATQPVVHSVAAPPSPTSRPATEIIHVYWTGRMRMVPTDLATAPPLPDGKAIIHLTGSPVSVHQLGADGKQSVVVRCNDLQYRTADSGARLRGNVVMEQTNAQGVVSTVMGEDLDFSHATQLATFTGPGQTRFPDPSDPKNILKSQWSTGATVQLYDTGREQMQISSADLEGDVDVNDEPRFRLTARRNVTLQFAGGDSAQSSSSGSPPLTQIAANGNVRCVVHEANQKDRLISGQHLELLRDAGPDGKFYAKTLLCDGDVHAQQEDQSLSCQNLRVDLLPTTRTSTGNDDLSSEVALDRLVATTDVNVTGKDGSSVSADDLDVQMIDDHPHVKLQGSADEPAVVRNKTSRMTGNVIELSPHDQTASVDGPGTFDGTEQPTDPNQTPRPLKLTWQNGASLDGNANHVEILGGVSAITQEADGTEDSANCDRIVGTLVDVAPSTQPVNRKSDGDALAAGSDFMRNKQLKLLSLQTDQGSAKKRSEVRSYLADSGGNLLHQFDLLAQTIDYDVATRRLSVAGPGDILAVENSSTTRPAQGSASVLGGQGSTAIDWKKRFIYDDANHSAVIEGDITVVHQDSAKSQSLRLDRADIVQAEFAPAVGQQPSASPKLQRVTATGPILIRTTDKTVDCGELDFDAVTQVLTCLGGEIGKVTVIDNANLSQVDCQQAVIDIKTGELIKMTQVTAHGQ
jgi:lipopolysaccharide export system protein LptA